MQLPLRCAARDAQLEAATSKAALTDGTTTRRWSLLHRGGQLCAAPFTAAARWLSPSATAPRPSAAPALPQPPPTTPATAGEARLPAPSANADDARRHTYQETSSTPATDYGGRDAQSAHHTAGGDDGEAAAHPPAWDRHSLSLPREQARAVPAGAPAIARTGSVNKHVPVYGSSGIPDDYDYVPAAASTKSAGRFF